MLYETLKQGVIFLSMLYFGMLGGVLYDIKTVFTAPISKNKVVMIVFDALFCVLLAFLFLFSAYFTNFGEIRLYIVCSFFFGFSLERITIGTTLAKFLSFLYNTMKALLKKIKLLKLFHKKQKE